MYGFVVGVSAVRIRNSEIRTYYAFHSDANSFLSGVDTNRGPDSTITRSDISGSEASSRHCQSVMYASDVQLYQHQLLWQCAKSCREGSKQIFSSLIMPRNVDSILIKSLTLDTRKFAKRCSTNTCCVCTGSSRQPARRSQWHDEDRDEIVQDCVVPYCMQEAPSA